MATATTVAAAMAATEAPRTAVHEGGCHCGRVRWSMAVTWSIADVAPRACDCDFCTRHGAAWVSDPQGTLQVRTRGAALMRYRQGSGQAQFLLCAQCGVLVAVIARDEAGHLIGAANRNAFDAREAFAPAVTASPQQLAPGAKLSRWTQLWTPVAVEEQE